MFDPLSLWGVLLAALFGAVFGSFINVLAIRWHEGASIGGRSACPSCKSQLKAQHLVPIISWMVLRGRCAACHARIHPQYVAVEIAAALLAVIAALRWDPTNSTSLPHFLFEFVVSLGLLVPLIMDLRWKEIPVEYVIALGACAAIARGLIARADGTATFWMTLAWTGVAVCAATAFFGGQIVMSRGKWLGQGDLWLGIGMAGILGLQGLGIALYLAYVVGGIVAGIALLAGLVKRRTKLPFAPALVAGTLGAIWFGPLIAEWIAHALV